MKTNHKIGVVLSGALLLAGVAHAATLVTYTATADPNLNPDGLADGVTPVDVWQMTLPADTGTFFDAGRTAWASFSLTTATAEAVGEHTFVGGALTSGQGVELGFANKGVLGGRQVGIRLNSGGTTVFSLFFEGGGPGYYQYTDNATTGGDTGQGFAYDSFLDFSFTLTSATSYNATFGSGSFSGTVDNLSIDTIEVFNDAREAGGNNDVFFRDLAVVPEPSSVLLLASVVGVMAVILRRRSSR
jgi:hypothetical protein